MAVLSDLQTPEVAYDSEKNYFLSYHVVVPRLRKTQVTVVCQGHKPQTDEPSDVTLASPMVEEADDENGTSDSKQLFVIVVNENA